MDSPALHNIACRLHRGSEALGRTCVYGKSNRTKCIGHMNWGGHRVTLGLAGPHGLAKLVLAMRWRCGEAELKTLDHVTFNPTAKQRGKAQKS